MRLRYGFVVECTGCDKDAAGKVIAVHCNYYADSKSGTPGADSYKVKGNIHWVSARHAYQCEVRLYDRLFREAHPGAGERDFLLDLNPAAKTVISAQLEPALKDAQAGGALPVRAARLLRRRPHRLEARRAGVQPRGDLEGHLAEVKT